MTIREPRAVLLDVDGTLVDSNDAHAQSWVEAFATVGLEIPFAPIRACIGMGGDKLMPKVSGIPDDGNARAEAIKSARSKIFTDKFAPTLRAFPGTKELIETLHERGWTLVVATSAKADEIEMILAPTGVAHLLTARTTSDDAERSKPDPDIVQVAFGLAKSDPSRTFMLGDTPYDVEAANRANLQAIALRCGGWKDADLAGALIVYEDPAELLVRLADSPLGG